MNRVIKTILYERLSPCLVDQKEDGEIKDVSKQISRPYR